MKKLFLTLFVTSMAFAAMAQTQRLWIFFSDKGENTNIALSHPEYFLSKEAIVMKQQKGIAITTQDLPVNQDYTAALHLKGAKILSTSKWLNAAAVEVTPQQWAEVQTLPFVTGARPVQTLSVSRKEGNAQLQMLSTYLQALQKPKLQPEGYVFDYGEALEQAEMLKVPAMHKRGITGKGVRIAVFDAGFDGVDTIDVFDSLWIQKRIVAWYDFVDNDKTLFRNDSHGTNVLSCIAANQPGEMVGIAPHVTVMLARTEDSGSETNREEYNWVRAMEWADSIGVDIIHSSLGYSKFDDGKGSYTYKDMDGNTAICTKAADLAAKRGIIVTVSAGNEGADAWKYITAPSDADSVLCVGAVTKTGKRASFSSMGPSSDGQVKPDVMAIGKSTTVAAPGNYITVSDGTSFSGPIMGGFMALLRQAHPKRSNMDLIQATRMSGDQFNFPDGEYGYGIPNVLVADSLLKNAGNLALVKMPGTEKPTRGAKPKIEAPKPATTFATNPKSNVNLVGNTLTVKTSNSNTFIQMVEIKKDDLRVVFAKSLVNIKDTEAIFDTRYLTKGTHYVHIKTNDYEENVKFEVK